MPSGQRSRGEKATQRSAIARVPPWLLAFLLTGCPLDPVVTGTGGGGTTSSTTTITTTSVTLTMTAGCMAAMDPNECDDGNPCTVDTCEDGVCSYEPAAAGTPCPDASACNGDETCDAGGLCTAGTPKVIDDGDECTIDACDPATGEVTHGTSPACGDWEETPTTGAPLARTGHTAVWTGTEMIVWGGEVSTAVDPAGVTSTGARYDPVAKAWTAMSTTGAPPPRHSHQAVWTGSKMIVWGGLDDTALEGAGGDYDPATDAWAALNTTGAPQPRIQHRMVWTGSQMIVWGGLNMVALGTGARYDLAADTWTSMPAGASPRFAHSAVWTGSKMIVWGGNDYFDWHQDGQLFDPATGWGGQTSLTDAPARREAEITVWTGSQMIVWGGFDGGIRLNNGGVFDPAAGTSGTWTPITETGAPLGREKHVGVWTGSQLMVWGGCGDDSCASPSPPFGDGGFWTPGPDGGTWSPLAEGEVTTARVNATGVWANDRVIVWGGKAGLTGKLLDTGAQSVP